MESATGRFLTIAVSGGAMQLLSNSGTRVRHPAWGLLHALLYRSTLDKRYLLLRAKDDVNARTSCYRYRGFVLLASPSLADSNRCWNC